MPSRGPASLEGWRRQAVRRMVASRRSTLAFVTRLPVRELMKARTQGGWSVKDVLGHLLGCDEETVRRLQLIARGRGDRIQWFHDMAHADRFNARSVARTRRLGLRTLLGRMQRVRADLIKRLERLPAEALRDPSHDYTVVQWLPAPGWSHERDHLGEIRVWWRSSVSQAAVTGAARRRGTGRRQRASPR